MAKIRWSKDSLEDLKEIYHFIALDSPYYAALLKDRVKEEIDRIVAVQAEDMSAWEKPVKVRRSKPTSVSLPANLAAQAAFFARLHREASLENWLNRIIRERLDIEEAAFSGFKKDLLTKNSR